MNFRDPSAPGVPNSPIRIAISSCLLGEKVRFDGGHKLNRFITETLGKVFEWVPVCPEVEAGFGIPREAMRLEEVEGEVGLWTVRSHSDLTSQMKSYAEKRIKELAGISGYILKRNSPSCGLFKVRIFSNANLPMKTGRGLFAQALLTRFPALPMEEEDRLCDRRIRENWIQRVFACYRLNLFWASRWTIRTLQSFHAEHKLVLLSHSPQGTRRLGRLVTQAKDISRQGLRQRYELDFMQIMSAIATPGKHTNVLQHAAGYLKNLLDSEERRELCALIQDYRNGRVPLVAPLTLIRHYLKQFDIPYLAGQAYFNPHPKELAALNHV